MHSLHIDDIEAAINYWRLRAPADAHGTLAAPTRALAELYATMAHSGQSAIDLPQVSPSAWQAWLDWYASTPDTPCIAICSTAQGDEVCKGCGRSAEEVRMWGAMHPTDKRAVWRRITTEASAWRFNRYIERAN